MRTESVARGGMYAGLESPVREYLPTTGRFDRPDPLGLGAVKKGDPGSWNRFAYVQGDPVNYNDPRGLARCYVLGTYTIANPDEWQTQAQVQCVSAGGTIELTITAPVSPLPLAPLSKDTWEALNLRFASTIGADLDRQEWEQTLASLNGMAARIQAMEFSNDCLTAISSIRMVGTNQAATAAGLRLAARNVVFRNGLTTTDTVGGMSVADTFKDSRRYATAATPGSVVYWRPGSEQGQPEGWLGGALMHELLHNMGFNHLEMYTGLNLLGQAAVNLNNSDLISRELGARCFGMR
ncbi:MAG: hypothetical protein HYX26_09860 [Acidobacteriales bacterium]|nr:hypothetical protein [Terriglobales bacterium]